jgi:hypothetical protein
LAQAYLDYAFDPAWQTKIDGKLLNIKTFSDHSIAIKLWKKLYEKLQMSGIEIIDFSQAPRK